MGETPGIMKHKMLTSLAAAGGFLALSVSPTWAADADKTADAEVQTEGVNVTTVLIQGGG